MTSIQLEPGITFIMYFLLLFGAFADAAANLSCYQCSRNSHEECGAESLLPCSSISDRCVTHVTKSDEQGLTIKRECGLGPCGFDDDIISKGLGWDTCDRSNNEYVCLLCCKENGCNKNGTFVILPSVFIITTLSILFLIRMIDRYGLPNDDIFLALYC